MRTSARPAERALSAHPLPVWVSRGADAKEQRCVALSRAFSKVWAGQRFTSCVHCLAICFWSKLRTRCCCLYIISVYSRLHKRGRKQLCQWMRQPELFRWLFAKVHFVNFSSAAADGFRARRVLKNRTSLQGVDPARSRFVSCTPRLKSLASCASLGCRYRRRRPHKRDKTCNGALNHEYVRRPNFIGS